LPDALAIFPQKFCPLGNWPLAVLDPFNAAINLILNQLIKYIMFNKSSALDCQISSTGSRDTPFFVHGQNSLLNMYAETGGQL